MRIFAERILWFDVVFGTIRRVDERTICSKTGCEKSAGWYGGSVQIVEKALSIHAVN